MNEFQRLWWEQAKSDFQAFDILRTAGANPCHLLHYLQMLTEKLGKAYFWKSGKQPDRITHLAFVRYLRSLNGRSNQDRSRIAKALGLNTPDGMSDWILKNITFAYEIEHLAPALAQMTRPNPEYPWPDHAPAIAPCEFEFPAWKHLQSNAGRKFLQVIRLSVLHFGAYC